MKLFYVTFRNEHSLIEMTERAIIGQIGYRYAFARIMPTCHHGVFNESIHKPPRYTRHFEVRSRALVGCLSIEDALNCVCDLAPKSLIVTQFTLEQAKSFRTLGMQTYMEMLNAFYMSCDNSKSNRIYHQMLQRINAHQAQSWRSHFQWHGNHVYPQNYTEIRALYRDLGALVAQVEQDGDSTPVDEFLMDKCDRAGVDAIALYDSISEKVNLGLTHCDCGHLEYDGDTQEVRSDTWCRQCFEDDAVYVENRDEYWSRDDAYYHESDGCYYSYDEDDDDEDNNQDTDALMSYSTNVLHYLSKDLTIKSSPHGDFLMGIEFEMETREGSSVNNAVDDVRSQLGQEYCVCKADGSLGSYGLEIVTAPRGLAEHIKRFKGWEIDSSYRAWDTKRCGLHVHIDSRAFTQMTLGKFIMLINSDTNVEFIRKIAGRHPHTDDQARSYCASERQEVVVNPKKAVKDKSHERYRMVNLQNLGLKESKRLTSTNAYDGKYDTVELRIFRASLSKTRMLAQIEFTHACVCFCRVASWRDLNQTSFVKYLKTVSSQYPNLADWYGVRRRTAKVTAESQCRDAVESV